MGLVQEALSYPLTDNANYDKEEEKLIGMWPLAIQIEAGVLRCENGKFVAMPTYSLGHKEYLHFILKKIVYFLKEYPNDKDEYITDIIGRLALEFLASTYQININPDQENPSPSIKCIVTELG